MTRPPLNHRFGNVIVPMMRPMYILQMGRTKSWSKKKRREHLLNFRDACIEARDLANQEIELLDREIRRERYDAGTPGF